MGAWRRFGLSLSAVVTAVVCGVGSAVAVPVVPGGPDGSLGRPSSDCTIIGTSGSDVLRGTRGADVICGLGGNDRIFGGRGNDLLRGGRGNDRVFGGAGNDLLRGGAPSPLVARGTGGDLLIGGRGADRLRAENGVDMLFGGPGPDTLWGGAGADRVVGGPGFDRMGGGPGADRLDARDGAGFVDRVSCGPGGADIARADVQDHVNADCETYPDNRPPTDLRLSNASVRENRPAGTTVGRLSAVDPNAGDRVTFALVPGAGGADNGSFRIVGRHLVTRAVFDFETKASYSVRIEARDTRGASDTRQFTIAVSDQAENETPVARNGMRSTAEDTAVPLDLAALASDAETADGDLSFAIITPPTHGTATSSSYTPGPDFNGTDTLTYRVTDRGNPDGCTPAPGCAPAKSATGTVTITVSPVNDVPTASPGTRSTDEDTPVPLDLGSLVADVETSDANLTYEIVTPPTNGAVTGTGESRTYTPDRDFNGTDTLTYRVTDRGDPDNCTGGLPTCDAATTSTTSTVSITVNPVNDPPLTPDATRTTDEDTPVAIDLAALANDVETADANLAFTVTQPAHGAVTGTGGARTYTPDPDFSGTDTFSYTVTDRGDPDNCVSGPGCDAPRSATGTVTISVGAVNDPPVNTLPPGPVTALPNTDTPITGLSIADVDAGTDQVAVTLSVQHGTLTVDTAHLDASQIAGNGTATLVITASITAINETLNEGVVFRVTANDTLTMTTDDLGHNGAGGAQSDSDSLPIVVNSVPVADAQSVAPDEDTPTAITLSATDADGDPLTFAIGSGPTHGTVGPIGPVSCGANACTANVTYTPDADYNGPDGFTFTANDGVSSSASATVSIAVGAVNDAPRLDNLEGTALTYTENAPATPLTATTTVTDVDSADFDTGTLTVDFSTGGTADDRMEILPVGDIALSGSTVMRGGISIGTFTGGVGTTPLVVTLNANATPAATQDLVRAIGYRNVSDNPSTAPRTVRFVLTDGDGGVSIPVTRDIAVTAVNDPPVLTVPGGRTVAEDTPLTLGGANAISVADADAGSGSARVTLGVLDGTITINTTTGLTVIGNNTASVTLTGAIANLNAGLDGITYTPAANFNDTRGSEVLSVGIDDLGNTGSGGAHTASATVPISVTPVNDPPVAAPHTYTAQANMKVTNLGSLLTGATDPDAGDGGFTSTLVVGTDISATSPAGGTVTTLNQNTGIFDFEPPPGVTGPVTFTYTVCDNGNPNPPSLCSAPATVTINVAGPVIWFVNPNANPAFANGELDRPFATLAAAGTAIGANTGERIFLFAGNYPTGRTMNTGEWLVGQGATNSPTNTFDALMDINPPVGTIARPAIGPPNGTATLQGTVTLNTNTTTRGIALSTGASTAMNDPVASISGVTVDQVSLTTTTGTALALNDLTASDLTYTGVTTSDGPGVMLTGTNTNTTFTFAGGVTISSGANPGFSSTGGGTVSVTGASNTLATTTATALNVANTTIGATGLNFRSISAGTAANGPASGIVLNHTGSSGSLSVTGNGGTCTNVDTSGCSGGQIQHTTGADDSSATPAGTGIVLNDTLAPSFTRLWIHDHSNYGIRGTNVNGFTLANSVINGSNGTNSATPFNDSSVYFNNNSGVALQGSASITNTFIGGGFTNNFWVLNTAGSLNRITFDTVTIGANSTTDGNKGIQVEGIGSATVNATVKNSTFTSSRGDLFGMQADGTGGGDLDFDSNTLSNNHPAIATGGGGVTIIGGTAGPFHFNIHGTNTFRDAVGHAVNIVKDVGTGSVNGTITGAHIGVANVANSGSLQGSGLNILDEGGGGSMTVAVTNNTLTQYNNDGITLTVGGGVVSNGNFDATVTGNTLGPMGTNPGGFPGVGIRLTSGVTPGTPGDSFQTCAQVGGAGGLKNTLTNSGIGGASSDYRVRQRFNTTVRLPGYAGAPGDTNAVTAFIDGNNTVTQSPGGTASADFNNSPSTGGGFVGGAACAQPTP